MAYSGLPVATASALAAHTPTIRAPASPGPEVTAMASTSSSVTPASARASRSVGTKASRCAREAISGMTPPNRTCSSMEEDTVLVSRCVPRTIPTPVSSQEDSMPRTRGPVLGAVHGRSASVGSVGREWLGGAEPEPHDQGVDAVAVIAAADVDLFEPETAVELLGTGIVGPDFQQHVLGAAPPAFPDEFGQQRGADPLAFLLGHDGDGLDVRDRPMHISPA